jgi:hypothetical protein
MNRCLRFSLPFFICLCAHTLAAKPFLSDTLPPSITCPSIAPIALSGTTCQTPVTYEVLFSDDEPDPVLTQLQGIPSGAEFPNGITINVFQATDQSGLTATCSFTVSVKATYQNYYIRFPDDRIVTACSPTFDYGKPEVLSLGCELIDITFEDAFPMAFDACYRIERSWNVINWATYNPLVSLVYVPNPAPLPTTNAAANLVGPVVSLDQTPGSPWASTVVKVNPTDPTATNYSVFWNQNANGYRYKQSIKVIDMEDPFAIDYPTGTVQILDSTDNDNALWNADYYWDELHSTHDLSEEKANLSIRATDACSGANLNVEYTLFLDLDGDGTMETIVKSDLLPPSDTIYVGNNDGDADFKDGTPRNFDFRLVPKEQKWRFAIQEKVSGNIRTAQLRWSTAQDPYVYVDPILPHGTHKIKWFVSDGCGNDNVYEHTFRVSDAKPPEVFCLQGIGASILSFQGVKLWDTDVLASTKDNCASTIQTAVRKSGSGTGFPEDGNGQPINSVTYICNELGTQALELWARDASGNASFCETNIQITDNNMLCGLDSFTVSGNLDLFCSASDLSGVVVEILTSHPGLPGSLFYTTSTADGVYGVTLPINGLVNPLVVTPHKDIDPLEGVSTLDLVQIGQFILAYDTFNSPYKFVAADINDDGDITTLDIVEARRVILGINNEFPNSSSWRFIPKSYQFPNIQNPVSVPYPRSVTFAPGSPLPLIADFWGVKIGDLQCQYPPNLLGDSPDIFLQANDGQYRPGETVELHLKAGQPLQGAQFTLEFPGYTLQEIVPGAGQTLENFGVFTEKITFSQEKSGQMDFSLRLRAEREGYLSESLRLSSSITPNEGYLDLSGQRHALNLAFANAPQKNTLTVLPNPVSNQADLVFHTTADAEVLLTVTDQTGKIVWEQTKFYASGRHVVPFQSNLLPSAGIYTVYLDTPQGRLAQKMVVTR